MSISCVQYGIKITMTEQQTGGPQSFKPEISRRDVLHGGAGSVLTGVLAKAGISPRSAEAGPEPEKSAVLDWKEIGPPTPEKYNPHNEKYNVSGGIRALYADPEHPDFTMAASQNWTGGPTAEFKITADGGRTGWADEKPFKNERGVGRDYLGLPDGSVLLVADYAVARRGPSGGWDEYSLPKGISVAQTARLSKDGRLLVAGKGGIGWASLEKLNELKDPNNWKMSQNIPQWSMIRTMVTDKDGTIYTSGWGGSTSPYYKQMEEGPGIWWSKDNGESFQPAGEIAEAVRDSRGRVNGNTIELGDYRGSKLMFIGCEGGGSGRDGDRPYDPNFRSFFICVDGKVYDSEKTDVKGLCSALGQDLITPQRGIVVSYITRKVYVSSWSQHIAACDLDAILSGEKLNWQRVTKPGPQDATFGAGLMVLSTDKSGIDKLFTGGERYVHKDPANKPYVPVRAAELK